MFCETNGTNVASSWLAVAAMDWLVQRAVARGTPTYILILDSDAYVRAMNTRLEDWFATNDVSFPSASWSLMLSSESKVATFDPATMGRPNFFNCGVLYGYVDPAQQDRTKGFLAMLRLWQSASCSEALCLYFAKAHPWEQGCLEKLMYNETLRASSLSTELQLLQSAVYGNFELIFVYFARGFSSQPHPTRRTVFSACCPCPSGVDWCLQSDDVPDSRLQARVAAADEPVERAVGNLCPPRVGWAGGGQALQLLYRHD